MRVIIAGSRGVTSIREVEEAVNASGWRQDITCVVSGTTRGVDRLGEQWAENNGISVARFPANWDKYGKSAGYRRNEQMAGEADRLIAIWDGTSRGTKHMVDIAKREGLQVHVHTPTQ